MDLGERAVMPMGDVGGSIVTGDHNVLADHLSLNLPPEMLGQFLEAFRKSAAQAARPRVADLFRIVRDENEVLPNLYPSLHPSTHLKPYDSEVIPYLPVRNEDVTDTRAWLKARLGRVLVVVGPRGGGRTREIAELARELCAERWTVCVAEFSQQLKMGAASDVLQDDKLLFVIDDLHKTLRASAGERSYWDRFHEFLRPYLDMPSVKVRVLVSTLPEKNHAHLPGPDHPLRKGLKVGELPDFDLPGLRALLTTVAARAGVLLAPDDADVLVRTGNRRPKTVVANVERAAREGTALGVDTWTHTWEGSWITEFKDVWQQDTEAAAVYRSLYLLRQARVPGRIEYVLHLKDPRSAGDRRDAVDRLVRLGLLAQREDRLTAFSDEQLTDSLESVDEPVPALKTSWEAILHTVCEPPGEREPWASDLTSLAEVLVDAKLWQQGEEVATRALERDSEQVDALLWRSQARFQSGRNAEAEEDASHYLAFRPDDANVRLMRASMRLMLRDYAGAETDATVAIEAGQEQAYVIRGFARTLLGNLDQAQEDISRLTGTEYADLNTYRTLGYLQARRGDHRGAVESYTRALELAAKDPISLQMRGISSLQLGDFDGLVADMSALVDLQRGSLARALRALGYFRQGKVDEALEDIDKVVESLEVDPFSRVMAKMAVAMEDVEAGRELSPELARELASLAPDMGIPTEDMEKTVPLIRDSVEGYLAELRGGHTSTTLRLWSQPEATYRQMRGELYFAKGLFDRATEDFEAAMAKGLDRTISYQWLGRAATARGDLRAAEDWLTKLIDEAPESPLGYFFRGAVHVDLRRREEALVDLQAAQDRGLEVAHLFFLRGLCLLQLARLEEAEQALSEALAREPRHPQAHYLLAATHLRRQRFDAALAEYDRAVALGFENVHVFAERGLAYLGLEDAEASRADVKRAKEAGGKDPHLSLLLGIERLDENDHASAEAHFTEAIDGGADGPFVRAQRAHAQFLQKRYAEAEANFTHAIEAGLEDAVVFARRGWSRFMLGELDDALSDLDRAVIASSADAPLRYLRAKVREKKEDHAGVIEDLDFFIEHGEPDADDYFDRGVAHFHLNANPEAKADFDRAQELGLDHIYLHGYRAISRLGTRDYEGAVADCNRFIETSDTEWALMFQVRALALSFLGRVEEAGEDCRRAMELAPDEALTQRCRGYFRLAGGDFRGAIEAFEAELELDPEPGVYFRLGLAQHLAGRSSNSSRSYAKGLERAAEDDREEAFYELGFWRERLLKGSPASTSEGAASDIRSLLSS